MAVLRMGISNDFSELDKFCNNVIHSLEEGLNNPHIRDGFDRADSVYVDIQKQLFSENAQGGGEWEELANYTRRDRERLGFPPDHPILFRLGVLFGAYYRGAPGNYFYIDADSITSGFGGDELHPGYEGEETLTISDIADIHNNGFGRTPQRILLHPVDDEAAEQMNREIYDGLRKMFDQACEDAKA